MGRADSFCLMNRFQAYLGTNKDRQSFKPSTIFYIGGKDEMLVIQSPQWLLSSSRCTERGKEGKEFEGV